MSSIHVSFCLFIFFRHYDHNYVNIDSCTVGKDWADKAQFIVDVDGTFGQAHLGGTGGDAQGKSSVAGKILYLATCELKVLVSTPAIVEIKVDINDLGVLKFGQTIT